MTDIFKAIADANARTLLEAVADNPGLSAAKLEAESGLKTEVVTKQIANLLEAGLVKTTGSGASKKYSVNAKGFAPYVSYLAKVAEKQAVSSLEAQLTELSEKLGEVIANGTEWISDKANASNIQLDPKAWAKELGRKMAEAKVEIQKEGKLVAGEAKKLAEQVKTQVKTQAKTKGKK